MDLIFEELGKNLGNFLKFKKNLKEYYFEKMRS